MLSELRSLGLSYYEARALQVVLQGRVRVKELWRRARVPPGKVYSVVRSLREKGLVEESESRPKEVYVANASAVLQRLIRQRQRQDEALFSVVRGVAVEVDRARSRASRFFEVGSTLEENRRIQLRVFVEAQREVCQVLNVHHKPSSNRASKGVWEREIVRAVGRGVRFRVIYPPGVELPRLLRLLPRDRFVVRRLATDFVRCDVVDQKRVLVKLVQEDVVAFGGVVFVEDERFARNLQGVFEQLWERAEGGL